MIARPGIVGTLLFCFLLFAGPLPAEEGGTPTTGDQEDAEVIAMLELLELLEMLRDFEVIAAMEEEKK